MGTQEEYGQEDSKNQKRKNIKKLGQKRENDVQTQKEKEMISENAQIVLRDLVLKEGLGEKTLAGGAGGGVAGAAGGAVAGAAAGGAAASGHIAAGLIAGGAITGAGAGVAIGAGLHAIHKLAKAIHGHYKRKGERKQAEHAVKMAELASKLKKGHKK